ncbi:hypothetical protein GX50_01353 [[Emmonsia] crescens]|uniref:Uncharacterized protein n=1 Tax=[Emmonsia] crescens TaxID=73230 RepID=A0A2B7ZR36_9EURO|nr:hypothetical protein GX50_01353 [Emmonsia crescens]
MLHRRSMDLNNQMRVYLAAAFKQSYQEAPGKHEELRKTAKNSQIFTHTIRDFSSSNQPVAIERSADERALSKVPHGIVNRESTDRAGNLNWIKVVLG